MESDFFFKIIGAIGLLLIAYGILQRHKRQDTLFIAGGVLLEVYSIYLEDPIFVILQLVFIASAIWDYNHRK